MTNATRQRTSIIDPQREYVASGGGSAISSYRNAVRALPHTLDDVTRDLGDDLYERMQHDPVVTACLNIYKASILEDGVHMWSPIEDEADPQWSLGQEIATWCTDVLNELDTSLDDVLWDLLDALALGNKVAEEVYVQRDGKLVLRALKVKPRATVAFVVDAFLNVLGFAYRKAGQPSWLTLTHLEPSDILPRDKFAVLSFRPKNSDPRGTSILRPAYNAWWLKMQTWPELLKFLAQFGTKSVWGTTPENAKGRIEYDSADNPIETTPEQLMLQELLQIQNGAAIALPYGSQLNTIGGDNEGKALTAAIDIYDRQIMLAIVHQTLAMAEAEHASRAQAEVHQDTIGKILRQAKKAVCRMLAREVLRPLVRYNYGDAAVPLTPRVSLGEVEQQDVTGLMSAVASLQSSGWFDDAPEQRPHWDVKLGAPPRQVDRASTAEDDTDDTDEGDEK